jgi:long-chain acyl-CoA synthetase
VQPTRFFAVPRIWEKIHAGVEIKMASASRLKRANYRLWSRVAAHIGAQRAANDGGHTATTRLLYALGHPFLFRALRDRIGLREVISAGSGAAPISSEILQWFLGIGVPILELYGMTENSAVATATRMGRVKLGCVGEPHTDTELRIDDETGEILTRHPGVFAGYWRNPDATAAVLDADGWLHTGDVGEWVDGTHVRITDRMKDIIITSGGKNVAPSEIENSLKASPYIKEAIIIGDGRRYLTALIGIELDTVADWAQRHGLPFTTYRDLSEKEETIALVQQVVDRTNAKFARVEQIKRFAMLPKELDHEDGELTATQKVKRAAIADVFGDLVEPMYEGIR